MNRVFTSVIFIVGIAILGLSFFFASHSSLFSNNVSSPTLKSNQADIQVTVLDEQTQTALSSANVSLIYGKQLIASQTTTNSTGTFEFITNVVNGGLYQVSVSADGYVSKEANVVVQSGKIIPVSITLALKSNTTGN